MLQIKTQNNAKKKSLKKKQKTHNAKNRHIHKKQKNKKTELPT